MSKTLFIDSITQPFSVNPNTGDFRLASSLKLDALNNNIGIGNTAGQTTQGINSVAIGNSAGQTTQGANSIAIGYLAGQSSQAANTVVISALGTAVTGATANATYIAPVRNITQTTAIGYNTTTREVTYFNQNAASTPSGIAISGGTQNSTLTVNFNSSFSSVTKYTLNYVAGGTTVITINNYAFSNALVGGQYTLTIEIVIPSNPGVTYTFNGTGLPATVKTNFTTITTGSVNGPTTRYIVLTIAYDGTNYYMSGSTFA